MSVSGCRLTYVTCSVAISQQALSGTSLDGIGERIRQARRAAEIPVTVFAARTGVSRTAVHRWETGTSIPSDERLPTIAEVLGQSLSWLRGEADSEPDMSPMRRSELPPEVAKAARHLVDAFKREMALGGATSEELHYIETVLMTPNLPPTLAGGHVAPDRLLEHIQGLMDPIRSLLRDAGRQV